MTVPIEHVVERAVTVPQCTTVEVPVDRVVHHVVRVPQETVVEVPSGVRGGGVFNFGDSQVMKG